jgi:hypothetical protein
MGKVQRGSHNVASGDDQVAVQVGRTGGAKPPKPAPSPGGGSNANVRGGNATVGRQEDVIEGGLTFGR